MSLSVMSRSAGARSLVSLMVVGLLGASIGCGGGAGGTSEPGPPLRVDDLMYQLLPGDARIITGKVVNLSGAPLPVVQLQVSLFDEDNIRTHGMHIVVHDIPADSFRAFREAVDPDLNVHGVRIRSFLVP